MPDGVSESDCAECDGVSNSNRGERGERSGVCPTNLSPQTQFLATISRRAERLSLRNEIVSAARSVMMPAESTLGLFMGLAGRTALGIPNSCPQSVQWFSCFEGFPRGSRARAPYL